MEKNKKWKKTDIVMRETETKFKECSTFETWLSAR